jgi:hypothetical protein
MNLTLSKKTYSTSESIILNSDVDVYPVSASNFELYRVDGGDYTPIVVNASSSGSVITIVPEILEHNKIYVLISNMINSITLDDLLTVDIKRFFVFDDVFERNYNDIYHQLRNIDNIISIDNVVTESDHYDFNLTPSSYNIVTKKYEYDDNTLLINSNQLVLENYINQYFSEFNTLFYNIKNKNYLNADNPDITIEDYSDEYLNNINLAIMKNIVRYGALKGNIYLISFVLGLYTKFLGYNFISVVEDLSNNFVYRVSTSLPKSFWNKYIKPVVHPIGWNSVYNEITSFTGDTYADFDLINYQQKLRHLNWNINSVSYLDAEYYSTSLPIDPHFFKLRKVFHNQGALESYNVSAHIFTGHSNCKFINVLDQYNFNLKVGMSYHDTDFYIAPVSANPLLKVTHDTSNFITSYTSIDNITRFTYKQTGIAHSYIWEKYKGNTLLDIQHTFLNYYDTTINKDEYVILKLKNNDWITSTLKYDNTRYIQYISLFESWVSKNNSFKFNNIRNYNNVYFDFLSFDSFNSEKTAARLSITNDFDYTFESSLAEFIAEFDTPTSIIGEVSVYVY